MKLSWKNLKISIAGARLSHLVRKNKAWDPGNMTEQARIIFSLVQKANLSGNIDSLKKYLTEQCFRTLENHHATYHQKNKTSTPTNWIITEIAILEVHPGNGKRPDAFVAYIKILLEDPELKVPLNRLADYSHTLHWTFENQHGWWMLKEMKGSLLVERQTEKNTRKQQFH